MSYNRFTKLNKSQARAVAAAFTAQAKEFRRMEEYESGQLVEWDGRSELLKNLAHGGQTPFRLAALDAEARAAEAREIAEGKR